MAKSKKTKEDPKKFWEAYLKASLKQDWKKAKQALAAIIELEPNNSRTHLKMGDLLQKMGDVKGAVQSYHQAAAILVKLGFGQKAVALYKIILRLDPRDKLAKSESQKLLEPPKPKAPAPAPAPPLEEPAPQPETVAPPAESEIPTEELPAPVESVPVPEERPTIAEPSPDQMPEETGWPSSQELPMEGFTTAPQAVSEIPELALEIPDAEAEESIMSLYEEPEPPAGPEVEIVLSGEAGAALKDWSGLLPEIFWSLNKDEITQLFNDSRLCTYSPGETIVQEGDSGDSIFAILKGSAKVTALMEGKTVELATLSDGDVFGEVAFLSGMPRTATVTASTDLTALDISRGVLEKAIEKHPRVLSCLADYYHNRVRDTVSKVKRAKRPKSRFVVRD